MSKRFTDSKKWRNSWFRSLPLEAKLAWIYFCDECELHGVLKLDYGLASFQLGFDITPTVVSEWFKDKIHFLNDETIVIIQFFEFQYGQSADNWSAKVQARKKLENLGFTIENNKLVISHPTVVPQSSESVYTPLIIGIGKGIVNNSLKNKEEVNFKKTEKQKKESELPELIKIWNEFLTNKEFSKVKKTNPKRNKKIQNLWTKLDRSEWITVIQKINKSDFCRGIAKNSTGWVANFDWLLQEDSYLKVLEGNYDNRQPKQGQRGHLRDAETVASEFDTIVDEIRNE